MYAIRSYYAPVDDVEVLGRLDLGKVRGEGLQVLPVHRRPVAVEQPGGRQHLAAGVSYNFV